MAVYQILSLVLMFCLVSGTTHKKTSKPFSIFLAFLFSFLTMLQILSYYTTSKPFNYQVFIHMQPDSVSMAFDLFGLQIFLLLVLFFVFLFAYFFSHKPLDFFFTRFSFSIRLTALFSIFIFCLLSLIIPNDGILKQSYYLARNLTPPDNTKELSALLSSHGVYDYVKREDIVGSLGKNIIIISLESFERGFFNSTVFPDVAPNLKQMSESWTFFPNLIQSKGAEWTSGALYGLLTGMPAYFGIHGNTIFQTATNTYLASLGDVFHAAGYKMKWFMSQPAHAGNAKLLSLYHFDIFHDINHSIVDFEMSDADLFVQAKKAVASFAETKEPFVIGISTMSTHLPDGIPDDNFLHMKKKGDSGITYMARVTDYLVKDFCDFVMRQDGLDDTVIFIFPDHLAMSGSSALAELKAIGERSLYLLTNAPETAFVEKTTDSICTFDLPRMILQGAQIESNIRFITESLDQEKLTQRDFTDINLNLWTRHNINNGVTIDFVPNGDILVSADGIMRFQQQGYFEIADNGDLIVHNGLNTPNLLFALNNENKSVCIGTQRQMFSCFKGQESYIFTKREIEFIMKMHRYGIAKDCLSYPNHITIGSSGHQDTPSYAIFDDFRVNFNQPGLMLIFSNSLKIHEFNGISLDATSADFIHEIRLGVQKDTLLAIMAHGDVTRIISPVRLELESLHLSSLARLSAEESYIAIYAHDGVFWEHSDYKNQFMIRLPQVISSIPINSGYFTSELSADPSRYIAHAGGAINGKTYTNSLEAINNAYQSGYRLLELDIIETSDDKFVAAHDWKHWADITGYEGLIPPTHETFMQRRIYDQLTPLDMRTINQWFSTHPDAILVTDKLNRPIDFANKFIDKKRLMMELFSEQALEEVRTAGILNPICNFRILYNQYQSNHDLSSFIRQYDIQAASLPVSFLDKYPLLTRYLFENGVRLYGYTSNDANFISSNIGKRIYGVYTDNWPIQSAFGKITNQD